MTVRLTPTTATLVGETDRAGQSDHHARRSSARTRNHQTSVGAGG